LKQTVTMARSTLPLSLGKASVFLIGENGAGKTTVLDAIARSAGQGLRISKADFGDLANPLKIELTLSDLTNAQQGVAPAISSSKSARHRKFLIDNR